MLLKAGFKPRKILLWSSVIAAGVVAAVLGNVLLAGSELVTAVFCQALAGGAILALVAHTLIPEAIDDCGARFAHRVADGGGVPGRALPCDDRVVGLSCAILGAHHGVPRCSPAPPCS